MYDVYGARPSNMGFSETTDFVTYKNLGHFNEGVMKATNFTSPKHGAVTYLTKKEMKTIAEHYKVPLAGIWFVGDSLGDLEAAKAVDSQPVLVKTGKGEKTQAKNLPVGTLIFDDLAAVAAELINN